MRPILSNKEIIRFSGITTNFPTCELRTIFSAELTEFNICLGSAFRELLVSYLIDYTDIDLYDPDLMYAVDDIVLYNGDYYQAIGSVAANEAPPQIDKWKLAPKFNLDCVDEFWCTFLAEYLSLAVIVTKLPEIRTQITAEGTIQKISDHFNPASDKAYEHLYASFLGRKDDIFANMVRFVKSEIKTATGDCLEFYNTLKFIGVNCCSDCGECFDACICDDGCEDGRMLYEVG